MNIELREGVDAPGVPPRPPEVECFRRRRRGVTPRDAIEAPPPPGVLAPPPPLEPAIGAETREPDPGMPPALMPRGVRNGLRVDDGERSGARNDELPPLDLRIVEDGARLRAGDRDAIEDGDGGVIMPTEEPPATPLDGASTPPSPPPPAVSRRRSRRCCICDGLAVGTANTSLAPGIDDGLNAFNGCPPPSWL